jgi:hypothetical protein
VDSDKDKKDGHPGSVSRRSMIRRCAVALPAVLTLPSGAALANYSNGYIREAMNDPVDDKDRHLCVDLETVDPVQDKSGFVNLGAPPSADIYAIPTNREYRLEKNNGANVEIKSGADLCYEGNRDGAGYWYRDDTLDQWVNVQVPENGGFMVTERSLNSFAAAILTGDITIKQI